MTGRLWRLNSEGWHLDVDGAFQVVRGVEFHGASMRTRVALPGTTFDLPGNPTAVLEFEAKSIQIEGELPANDNNARAGSAGAVEGVLYGGDPATNGSIGAPIK